MPCPRDTRPVCDVRVWGAVAREVNEACVSADLRCRPPARPPRPHRREKLTSLAFSGPGDWVAVGSASLGQLLVWEWRSETSVLKQQGHYYDVATAAFSPDGALLATGADDAKVRSKAEGMREG